MRLDGRNGRPHPGRRVDRSPADATHVVPAALALAIGLGTNAGLDVDTPSWVTAYASTSRVPSDAAT